MRFPRARMNASTWLPAASFLWAVAMCLAYTRGLRLRADEVARSRVAVPPTLHYGDRLPAFNLRDAQGRRWDVGQLVGRWHLLVFADLRCPACHEQLAELGVAGLRECDTIAVMRGRPLVGSLRERCLDVAREWHLPFPVLVDENGSYSSRVCDGAGVPFEVFLGPDLRVRGVFVGYEPGVLPQVARFLGNDRRVRISTQQRRFASSAIVDDHGARRQFADVIRHGWSIVTFAKFGCPACDLRASLLARFRPSTGLRIIYVFRTPSECAQADNAARAIPHRNVFSTQLIDAARIRRFPFTMVFHDGSLACSETVPGPTADAVLWRFLGCVIDRRIETDVPRRALRGTLPG